MVGVRVNGWVKGKENLIVSESVCVIFRKE